MSEGESSSPRRGRVSLPDALIMALRFFSRLPTGNSAHLPPDLNPIAVVLPVASLLIGAIPALVLYGLTAAGFPPLFAAFVAAAAFAIVTGAMSEDAVADAADGLFGGANPARRLEILKDSRHGTYGVLAIVFVVSLKAIALSALTIHAPHSAALVWLAATMLARSGALYLSMRLGLARGDGAAAAAGTLSRNAFVIGVVIAVALALLLSVWFTGPLALLLALVLATVIVMGWTRLCAKLVGGQTGDLVGALQAMLEIAILAVFMRAMI